MKVLIVSFTFPPNKDGVSEAASAMAEGFLANSWQVEVLAQALPQPRIHSCADGLHIHEFINASGEIIIVNFGDESISYEEFIQSGDWDVIIFHAYGITLSKALPLLDGMSSKKMLVSHGYNGLIWDKMPRFPYGIPSLIRRFIRSLSMFRWIQRFDQVVYLSDTADLRGFYDHWIAKRAGYKGIKIIPNGVSLNEPVVYTGSFRHLHGIPKEAFMLVCVANYSPRKNQGSGARAFRNAAIPGSFLVFIGSEFNQWSEKFQAEDNHFPKDQNCGQIVWLENQSRKSTLEAIAESDLFILSANHEAQPIVLLEAMREAKPWVARNAGCISTLEGGICVRSESEMSAAILRLHEDPALRRSLGKAGRIAVESKYNRHAYTEAYISAVKELVESPSTPRE